MKASLTELQFLVRRACLGAGYPYGVADDAAGAVRWLCARGLAGPESLLRLLPRDPDSFAVAVPPDVDGSCWRWRGSSDAPLPVLLLGPALAELPPTMAGAGPGQIEFHGVDAPLMMLPWASRLAGAVNKGMIFAIETPELTLTWRLGPDGSVEGPENPREPEGPVTVCVTASTTADGSPLQPVLYETDVDDAVWSALAGHALKSYVPATDESRLRGAGAGLTDND